MPQEVCLGATLQCSFGAAPSALVVIDPRVLAESRPAANIGDHIPMVNIMPFGMCSSPANPAVIAATAAKAGVFTPVPCVPATPAPWVPGSPTVPLRGMPALNNASKCMCTYGGVIQVVVPGTTKEMLA
jgi:uncharacterized protein DUF4280